MFPLSPYYKFRNTFFDGNCKRRRSEGPHCLINSPHVVQKRRLASKSQAANYTLKHLGVASVYFCLPQKSPRYFYSGFTLDELINRRVNNHCRACLFSSPQVTSYFLHFISKVFLEIPHAAAASFALLWVLASCFNSSSVSSSRL